MKTHHGMAHSRKRILGQSDSFTCPRCNLDIDGSSREAHERRHRRISTAADTAAAAIEDDNFGLDGDFGGCGDFGGGGFGGDASTGDNTIPDRRFFMLEKQAAVEQSVLDRVAYTHCDAEQEIAGRTQRYFGQLCVNHNVSHSLRNAFLHFATDIKHDVRSLPKDMRAVHRRYDNIIKDEGRAVEVSESFL